MLKQLPLLKQLSFNANPGIRGALERQYKLLQGRVPHTMQYLHTDESCPMHPLLAIFQQKTPNVHCAITAMRNAFVDDVGSQEGSMSYTIKDLMRPRVRTLHGLLCLETEPNVQRQLQAIKQFRERFEAIIRLTKSDNGNNLLLPNPHEEQLLMSKLVEFQDCSRCKVVEIDQSNAEYN